MISNKEIAKVLRNSIEQCIEEHNCWGKVCGFDAIVDTKQIVNGEKLKDRIEALISILEIGE